MPRARTDIYMIESRGDGFSLRSADDVGETSFATLVAAVDAGREAALSRFRECGTTCCTRIRLADGRVLDDVSFGGRERQQRPA